MIDTTSYMIAGLIVITISILLYITSLVWRFRQVAQQRAVYLDYYNEMKSRHESDD